MPFDPYAFYGGAETFLPALPINLNALAGHVSDAHALYLKTIENLTKKAEPLIQALTTMKVGQRELLGPGARAIASALGSIYRTVGGLERGMGALPVEAARGFAQAATAPYTALGYLSSAALAPYTAEYRQAQAQEILSTLKPKPFIQTFFRKLAEKFGVGGETAPEVVGPYSKTLGYNLIPPTEIEQWIFGETERKKTRETKREALPMTPIGWF